MAYAEWKAKRADENAVMEAYFRKAPFKGCFTIFAGLDEVLLFLKNYRFSAQHLDYIKSQLPYLDPQFLDWLSNIPLESVKIEGVQDGTVVYQGEPLLKLTGPFAVL